MTWTSPGHGMVPRWGLSENGGKTNESKKCKLYTVENMMMNQLIRGISIFWKPNVEVTYFITVWNGGEKGR